MEMTDFFSTNSKEGKLPSKAIDIEMKNEFQSYDEQVLVEQKEVKTETDTDKSDTKIGSASRNIQKHVTDDTDLKARNFLQSFKIKTDTIYLKLVPDYHSLSVEQQAFFIKITEGIFGYNEQIRNEMLKILSVDCNVRQLASYLCIFIRETIQCNIVFSDLTLLIYSVRMTKSLLSNSHVDLKPHLHQILPAILSCALAKKISKYHYDNHWTLRDFSAYVIGMICNLYGNNINNISQRVIEIYKKPITDLSRPLTTLYGAIKGLGSLGEETVKDHILPNIPYIGNKLYIIIEKKTFYLEENKQQVAEAKHVRDATLNIVCPLLLKIKNVNDGGLQYVNEFGYLGQALYMQVKNLERIENDRRQSQFLRNSHYSVSNSYMRIPNFGQSMGYMPMIVSNFGMQYAP